MALDLTTTPPVGQATELTDFEQLLNNDKELAGAAAGVSIPLGGSLNEFVTDTSEVDLAEGWEREIDGTHLAACEVLLEVNVERGPDTAGGNVTVTVDLYDVTAGAQVGSSPVAVVLASTARTHSKSVALSLAAAVRRYKARIKVSDALKPCAAVAWVVIRGA